MTTKKQMRERVAAKRAEFDDAYRAEGQAALARSRDRDLQKQFDKEREENKKKAAAKIAAVHAAERAQETGYSKLIVDDRDEITTEEYLKASHVMHSNDLFKDDANA